MVRICAQAGAHCRLVDSWHVFLSYRSVHRPWVLQLYDSLREVGFSVYLDQFVLRASDNLVQALQRGLDESAAAILVWSAESEDLKWCEKEYYSLESCETRGGFRYGVVKLGETTLPDFAAEKIYLIIPFTHPAMMTR